jgi:hypothetical protein
MKRRLLKKGAKKGPNFNKKKGKCYNCGKKIILLRNADRLKLIMRKSTILTRNENERFKKNLK